MHRGDVMWCITHTFERANDGRLNHHAYFSEPSKGTSRNAIKGGKREEGLARMGPSRCRRGVREGKVAALTFLMWLIESAHRRGRTSCEALRRQTPVRNSAFERLYTLLVADIGCTRGLYLAGPIWSFRVSAR